MSCCAKAGRGTDPSQCIALFKTSAQLSGLTSVDPAKADACLVALRAASLESDFCSSGGPEECHCFDSNTGTVQPGGPCSTDADCAKDDRGPSECLPSYEDGISGNQCLVVADGDVGDSPCIGDKKSDNTVKLRFGESFPESGYFCDDAKGDILQSRNRIVRKIMGSLKFLLVLRTL